MFTIVSYNSEIFCAGPAVLKQGSNSIEFFVFRCLFDSISRYEASENHDYFNLDAYRPEFWGNGASQIHELEKKMPFAFFALVDLSAFYGLLGFLSF